ncbi:MmcQ/YjbR family DNA-binding protein [Bacillus spizizenii]|nr:MmcQ/YjbR family DNA-binding protein [Bacillus spizizenii]MCY8623265.1 MmcQ/YjbR family DNA-binding protein [Bacillus spizizenii]MCY8629982.1 MmcQ/YjbR family DNA-binding protein [Bacillus spizizenii]MCY8660825.1 MmcQ/YjbR family DNA-binding protein [Bacillus spizizenii]MCY8687956.1 MmcQ/YjbR family DNA-binding protein [Bacillus spizizenii]
MTMNEIIDYYLSYPDTYKDYPFGEGWTVMRHKGNKKLFALLFTLDGHLGVNLKCEPERANFLRSIYKEVKPEYHMNKDHWNTIILDGNLSKETIDDMTGPKKYQWH